MTESDFNQIPEHFRKSENENISFLKPWLIFFLVATVGGSLAGAVAGFFIGMTMGIIGSSLEQIRFICGVVAFAAGTVISFFTYKWSVKRFILSELSNKTEE
jgi:integral membrane sensor domain MASE1